VFSHEDKFTQYLYRCATTGDEADIFHPFFRAIIYRTDVINGAIALAERWNEFPQPVINFGGPDVVDRADFVGLIKQLAFPNLKYRVSEPDPDFFKNRPRVIRMSSPILASLLRYAPASLTDAITIERNHMELLTQ
jgi:dTDP-4-dehydrorhamnose reductase